MCICIFHPWHGRFNYLFILFSLSRLEKEYTRVKHKEAEDNEELRRLKTENRLLLQRVDELEKVKASSQDMCVFSLVIVVWLVL